MMRLSSILCGVLTIWTFAGSAWAADHGSTYSKWLRCYGNDFGYRYDDVEFQPNVVAATRELLSLGGEVNSPWYRPAAMSSDPVGFYLFGSESGYLYLFGEEIVGGSVQRIWSGVEIAEGCVWRNLKVTIGPEMTRVGVCVRHRPGEAQVQIERYDNLQDFSDQNGSEEHMGWERISLGSSDEIPLTVSLRILKAEVQKQLGGVVAEFREGYADAKEDIREEEREDPTSVNNNAEQNAYDLQMWFAFEKLDRCKGIDPDTDRLVKEIIAELKKSPL